MSEAYYQSESSVNEYIKMAEGHDGKVLISKMRSFLSGGSTVLEIGSGPGTDWNILSQTYNVTGSDNSSAFLKHLKSIYPGGDFLHLDAESLNVFSSFDAIYSNKVLHHLSDASLKKSIQKQWNILNESGIICHSFWKGKGDETFKGLYVNYHTRSEIKAFFDNRFDILLMEEYKEFEDGDSIFIIAKKK